MDTAVQVNGGITGVVAGSEALHRTTLMRRSLSDHKENIVFGCIVLTAQLVIMPPLSPLCFVSQQGR